MDTIEIIQNIDKRVAEIEREVGLLKQARSELLDGARATTQVERPNKRRRTSRRRRRVDRASTKQTVSAEAIERLLANGAGLSTGAVADQAGADRETVLALLKQLEAEGRVRRSGQRRATQWRRFTEEDAIAERAAELASRSRSAGHK